MPDRVSKSQKASPIDTAYNMLRRFLLSYAAYTVIETTNGMLAQNCLQIAAISWCRIFESKKNPYSCYSLVGREKMIDVLGEADFNDALEKVKRFRNLCAKGEEDYTDTSFFEKALAVVFAMDRILSNEPTLEKEYGKYLEEIGESFLKR